MRNELTPAQMAENQKRSIREKLAAGMPEPAKSQYEALLAGIEREYPSAN